MSEQQQPTSNQPKQTKTKEQLEKEKANTSAWQKKQEEKKKKKLQEQQEQKPVELDEKALEKAKRKEQKRLQRQQMLKEQQFAKQQQSGQTKPQQAKHQQVKKSETKQVKPEGKKQQKKVQEKPQPKQAQQLIKKESKKGAESSAKQQQQIRKLSKDKVPVPAIVPPKPVYTQLLTLQKHIAKSFPSVISINKPAQSRLIHKYLDQYINANDTVLILSKTDSWHPLAQRCTKRVYLYPNHEEFVKESSCENITCTYEDVGYLMEGTITKIFVQMEMVFANGNGLTQKGNQNIICMANEFKIPVIGFTGTWNFNAWNFLSINMFANKYGEHQFHHYDIIESEQLEIIVLEIGSVIPKQISGHLENLSKIYRGCDFNSIKW